MNTKPCGYNANPFQAGSSYYDPGLACTDPDAGDSSTFSFQSDTNSDRFSIDGATGNMTFAVEYDVDFGAMPSPVVITVYCVDSGNLSASASITVTINVRHLYSIK